MTKRFTRTIKVLEIRGTDANGQERVVTMDADASFTEVNQKIGTLKHEGFTVTGTQIVNDLYECSVDEFLSVARKVEKK